MTSSSRKIDRHAILIAGMHRSGTSALTRVFSLLGADLPENLAPALPDNNETGFWESVDLMILHDKMLIAAGSSWDDWTPFNPDWSQSAVGQQYKQKLAAVLQDDFAESGLFAVKDPRICRFLPFWLELLRESHINPAIVIPVRNPLEVAHSLKARDGFPLAKGGLLWLRHVLDAALFSADQPVAVVSYTQLMTDWGSVIGQVMQQTDIVFPRQSVASELEIEQYLDNRQKHNSYTFADVESCREFSSHVVATYRILQQWISGEAEPAVCRERLQFIRDQFDRENLPYAKLAQAQQITASNAQQDHEKSLNERIEHYEKRLQDQVDHYEKRLHDQVDHYEGRLQDKVDHYEERLQDQRDHYEKRLQDQLDHHALQLADQESSHAQKIAASIHQLQQQSHAEQEKAQQSEHNWNVRFADLTRELSQTGHQLTLLRKDFIFLSESAQNKDVEHDIQFLFDGDWYLQQYSDLKDYQGSAFAHYQESGWHEQRQPHPLFAAEWYLQRYPDVAETASNPLLHYVAHGGRELRDPHPLFRADYYVGRHPDALNAGLSSPLLHYLRYGGDWECQPHPLFDPQYFQRQLREDVPEGETLLAHYLLHPRLWRLSPSPAFDADYYLERYPDVLQAKVNPLLHYVCFGTRDQRIPHPEAEHASFRHRYGSLFQQLGVDAFSPAQPGGDTFANRPEESQQLISDKRFSNMLAYTRQPLQPDTQAFTIDQLTIHWVTCDFAHKGGGGNMTIFRFVRLFELFGHRQHIWLHNKSVHHDSESAYEDLVRNYQQTSAQIHFVQDAEPDFNEARGDIIIATDWESVWPVVSAQYFKRRFYFVQDHEPSFFAVGGHSLASSMTYHEDLDCICAGPWLEKLMQERYGRWATKFWLAADQQVYYPAEAPAQNVIPRVAFYARLSTSRRAVELGLLALDHLAAQGLVFNVDIYGSSDNASLLQQARFNYTDHGILSAYELGELYRQCDVGLVFSATNYSLVPQEMMACGLAVLELDGDNTRSVFPEGGVVLTKPHPEEIAKKLQRLLTDEPLRSGIAHAGQEWAQQFDWGTTARDVSHSIQQRLQDLGFKQDAESKVGSKVSVVVPVLNGGDLLLEVLNKVLGQRCPWPFDVLVIDSGSTDGTLDKMQQMVGVRVHCIDKSEFSHGGTRNLGVELTEGEYIAFLTQDALPADDYWLFNLVSVLEHEPQAAGAFGRHLPYSDHSPFVKRDLLAHFEGLGQFPLYLSKDTDSERFDSGDQGWRQVLHFYSDNNSCMRRSVWEQIPLPVIEYGEDQVWANQIIKAGYKKAYAVNAVVYHSHDYDEAEMFERSRIEAGFFREHFGYEMLAGKAEEEQQLAALNERDVVYANLLELEHEVLLEQQAINAARLSGYLAAEN